MKQNEKRWTLKSCTAITMAALIGIGSCAASISAGAATVPNLAGTANTLETDSDTDDDISFKSITGLESKNLLDEALFTPDETNVKVSSEHPDYPGTDALKGDGINYWKNGSTGIYKQEYEPSALFFAVDLGEEKTIESAYIVLANEAKYLNLTLDKVNAKNLANKFEIVYTSEKDIWDSLPEASDEVCEYTWQEGGWNLAGGTETEGLWSNTRLNDQDWACDTKTFHHPFTAQYVMVYISLLGEKNLPPSTDLGIVNLQLFGHDVYDNTIAIEPEKTNFYRSIASDVSVEIPTGMVLSKIELLTIPETQQRDKEGNPISDLPEKITLENEKDYVIFDNLVVFNYEYLMTLPPADNQFVLSFDTEEIALFTVSISSKSESTAILNAVNGISPFVVLGEGLGTDEPVEGATKRIRAAMPSSERHIINLYDEELDKYVFSVRAHDSDKCEDGCYAHKANYNLDTGVLTDGDNTRQRIEIRPSTDSGMDLVVAAENEITKYQWKWRLADDYPVTDRFNHIFQLKAVNAQRVGTLEGFTNPVQENGNAICSFTAVTSGLQFRYNDVIAKDKDGNTVAPIPMNDVRGRWIQVTLEVLHADDGWIKVLVTDALTKEVLMDFEGAFDTWRRPNQAGAELDYPACFDQYNRPKWGIYRNGAKGPDNLKETHLEIADLTITKEFNDADEPYITGIYLESPPDKLSYKIGESLDLSGMKVFAAYSNGQTAILDDSDYAVNELDSSRSGQKLITITVSVEKDGVVWELAERFYVYAEELEARAALQNKYDEYKNISNNNYTSKSWTVFTNALNTAKEILSKPDATEIEIETALNSLISAVLGLEKTSTGGSVKSSSSSAKIIAGGWKSDAKGWWFLNTDGTYPKNGWEKINGAWYLFDKEGYALKGWQLMNGNWYYLNETTNSKGLECSIATGWVFDSKFNGWFYLAESGEMLSGWRNLNQLWYYLNPASDGMKGKLFTNTTTPDGYHVNADGAWIQ